MLNVETEKGLYEAAFEGNVDALNRLLQEDESILRRVRLNCSIYSPIHIAVIQGHEDFVKAILTRNPDLSAELESAQKSSPLHLASAKGHLGIVDALLNANPDMCFAFDRDGRNPVHVAAIKGQLEVLGKLLQGPMGRPLAAREKTKRGEPILHLCVKHGKSRALRQLVDAGFDDYEFWNQRDADGLTALHLAVLSNQIEIVNDLLRTSIDVNAKNANGRTAMDIVPQNPIQQEPQIENSLRQAGALRAEQITEKANRLSNFKWFQKKSKDLMVVASLIATMAFQAGLNPPGGVWQDDLTTDSNGKRVPNPHSAGESIMAYHKLHYYKFFLRFNTTAFVSSLGTILLLVTGLPFKNTTFTWILRIVMWMTATSIAITYGFSIAFVTPAVDREQLGHVIQVAIGAWSCLITAILIGKLGYSMSKWWQSGEALAILPWTRRRNQDVGNLVNGHVIQLQLRRIQAN